jgi:hypothetical protein
MKKQPKKLVLKKETLRDLAAHDAGEVKGGGGRTKSCGFFCSVMPSCARKC